MDLRKLMDEDRSQYIEKKEFEIFLKYFSYSYTISENVILN